MSGPATHVFLLWHEHVIEPGNEDAKLIGVYSSEAEATQAQQRAAVRPGFRDAPDGFQIAAYVLDEDNWIEGYVTLRPGDGAAE